MTTDTYEVDIEGETYEVDAPDEETAWAWANAEHRKAKAPKPKPARPAFEVEAEEIASTTIPELIAANPMVRVATAAARPVLGAAALMERTWGGRDNLDRLRQLEEMQRRGSRALGFDQGPTVGGMQVFPSPGTTADISGAVLSPAAIAATRLPQAAGHIAKAVQGAEIGGLAGLTAGGEDPMTDAAIGGAVGGAIPGAIDLSKRLGAAVYRGAIEPWANPAAIKGRAYLEAAGDKVQQIIALLRQNKQHVPGSMPTAGEAAVPAGRAEFAALQQSAANVKPSDYLARADQQNAARLAAVRSVGQDKAALQAAEGARAGNAAQNYGAVASNRVNAADPALRQILARPSMEKAIERAKQLTAEQGGTWGNTVQNAQNVKMALDDMVKNPEQFGLGASEAKAIGETRTLFVRWLGQQSPGWNAARAQYAADSAPINRMEVGQYLENKLVPALSEEAKQTATTFAGAVRDAPGTIKRATGQPRYDDLSQVLTPQQMQVIQGVQDDLARLSRHGTMAKSGQQASTAASDVASASMEQPVGGKLRLGILDRGAMIANTIITRLEGRINKKLAAEIAVEMLNPPQVGESLRAAALRKARNENLARMIEQSRKVATFGGVQAAEQ